MNALKQKSESKQKQSAVRTGNPSARLSQPHLNRVKSFIGAEGDYVPPTYFGHPATERHEKRLQAQQAAALEQFMMAKATQPSLPIFAEDEVLQRHRMKAPLYDEPLVTPIGHHYHIDGPIMTHAPALPPLEFGRKKITRTDDCHLAGCFLIGPPPKPPASLGPLTSRPRPRALQDHGIY